LVSCRACASTLSLLPPGDTRAYPYFMGGILNRNSEPEKPFVLNALILVQNS
jgi:hypothetical protein